MFALYRNKSIDLQGKLIDLLLYDWYNGLECGYNSVFSPSDQNTPKDFTFYRFVI